MIVCEYEVELPCSEIRCVISHMDGYSGHADVRGLVEYIFAPNAETGECHPPKRVFLNHGELSARDGVHDALRSTVRELRKGKKTFPMPDVTIPLRGDPEFDLNGNCWVV